MSIEQTITDLIYDVKYPNTDKTIGELGLIDEIAQNGDSTELTVKMISPDSKGKKAFKRLLEDTLESMDQDVDVSLKLAVPSDGRVRTSGSEKIKNILAVSSGKGGVGKSTLSANLAVSLAKQGAKVGLMDADVYGPNIPMMMGVSALGKVEEADEGKVVIHPAESYGVKIMSIGFMVKPDQAVIWRGPMLHSAIQQFLNDVEWGELDYLIIDMPPGTGDVQLSLAQSSSLTAGLVVTLPQMVSVEDARRGLEMFRKLEIDVMGVIENMSYLTLPNGDKMDVFGMGGGEVLAEASEVPFLGSIPMDPQVRIGGDSGKPIVITDPDSDVSKAIEEIAVNAALETSLKNLTAPAPKINISMG